MILSPTEELFELICAIDEGRVPLDKDTILDRLRPIWGRLHHADQEQDAAEAETFVLTPYSPEVMKSLRPWLRRVLDAPDSPQRVTVTADATGVAEVRHYPPPVAPGEPP